QGVHRRMAGTIARGDGGRGFRRCGSGRQGAELRSGDDADGSLAARRQMTSNTSRPTRILFIGNSYTSRHQLPRLIADLAAAADTPQHIEPFAIGAGGASLRRHWNAGVAQKTLAPSTWDWVVLQEQSTLPAKNPQRYHENVRLFAAEAAKRGARLALYLTWSRQGAETQPQITRTVEEIAAEVHARVVPVGPA